MLAKPAPENQTPGAIRSHPVKVFPKWNWLLVLLPVWLLISGGLGAQSELSNLRDTLLPVVFPGQLVDTLTVAPGSLQLFSRLGVPVDPADYTLTGRYLAWNVTPDALPDSILRARYRVLPFTLGERARFLDSTQLIREEAGLVIGSYDDYVRPNLLGNDGKVRTNGSFTRGISVGNRQDLVLNSAFNLQLDGELGNGIEVSAAITDESLPIQPEGTTQQLREFDKIFIQLRKNRTQLTAGDYELRNPEGYFLRYYKKLEGATFSTEIGTPTLAREANPGAAAGAEEVGRAVDAELQTKDFRLKTSSSVAIARGQFTRQQITPIEGNQGPYKLTGTGSQRFLIVLAGTERIFLDGNLLVRGLDGDYVIDYNLAELTFTTRRLITRDSRITAEYEFADQRYVRTLATASSHFDAERFSAYVNGYTQQDSRTATGDLELTSLQRQRLSEAGDLAEGIPIFSLDTLGGRSEIRATYELRDTSYACGAETRDTFYLLASSTGTYVATFTDRGPNGGEYELDPDRPANERVYRFVGSDAETCLPNGSFAPLIDLVAPGQQQLISAGGAYYLKGGGSISMEASATKLDLNRFSDVDSEDDNGSALRLDYQKDFQIGSDSLAWSLATRGHFEYVGKTFNPINPYRSPEFFRNWNLSNRLGTVQPERRVERIAGGGLGLVRADLGRLDYDYEQFSRGANYLGRRHVGSTQILTAGWRVAGKFNYLESEEDGAEGSFRQPSLAVTKVFDRWGGWSLTGSYAGERALRQEMAVDTLSPFSFQFDKYAVGIETPTNEKYRLALGANRREDKLPLGSELAGSTSATEVSAEGNYQANEHVQLGGNVTYRSLDVLNDELVDDTQSSTFLGRLDLRVNALQRSLRAQTTYQVGSGQEPRVDFQYLFVGAGQGQYIWQDSLYNNDGRIQPNEMEISPFPDIADYVRVSVFTNDFIRTDNVSLNQSVNWDPSRIWREATGVKKFFRRFSANTSVLIDRKTRDDPDIDSWNPLQLGVPDSSLTALNLRQRHGLFFNRANPVYDVQLSRNDQRRRQVLTTGYEAIRNEDWTLRARVRPNDQLSIEAALENGRRTADSEFFNNKDYRIDRLAIEPSLNWQPGKVSVVSRLTLATEENTLAAGQGERTNRVEMSVEGNFNQWLTTSFRWVEIDLEGDARSPVGFALLQGLQPGRNLLWNVGATRELNDYLQLTVSYDGRQTGEAAVVHVGRVVVQARF
ncbi:hypothetical protein [Lewinella sp. 4G2]|uniref:hypothetical protein n=1 Tax=Lewinella sp. 4G2 TaxID=1803372 RepID=UPI0007DF11EE|nr:hypothetical protein [Lewinella sp. 4G2]OAV43580.1 hypothetical protein A3850_003305 [Lewinella sp. 4G2]